jgi:hypothetical protein
MMNHFLNHSFYGMLNVNKTETPNIFIKIKACRTQSHNKEQKKNSITIKQTVYYVKNKKKYYIIIGILLWQHVSVFI